MRNTPLLKIYRENSRQQKPATKCGLLPDKKIQSSGIKIIPQIAPQSLVEKKFLKETFMDTDTSLSSSSETEDEPIPADKREEKKKPATKADKSHNDHNNRNYEAEISTEELKKFVRFVKNNTFKDLNESCLT